MSIATQCAIAKFQLQILALGLQEYEADWRESGVVVRDALGRFANTLSEAGKVVQEQCSAILSSAFRTMEPDHLASMVEGAFGESSQQMRDTLSQQYESISTDLAEAIKQNPFPDLTAKVKTVTEQLLSGAKAGVTGAAKLFGTAFAKHTDLIKWFFDSSKFKDYPPVIKQLAGLVSGAVGVGILAAECLAFEAIAETFLIPLLPAIPGLVGTPLEDLLAIAIRNLPFWFNVKTDIDADALRRGITKEAWDKMAFKEKAIEVGREAWTGLWAILGIGATIIGFKIIGNVSTAAKLGIAVSKKYINKTTPEINAQVRTVMKSLENKIPAIAKEAEEKMTAYISRTQNNRPMPPEIKTFVTKRIDDLETKLQERFKDNPEFPKLMQAANANLTRILYDCDIHIRAPEEVVKEILNNRFVNTLENNYRSLPGYVNKRKAVEKFFYGYKKDADPAQRPIYGFLARPGKWATEEGGKTLDYGDAVIKLKESARKRATVLSHDSFKAHDLETATSLLENPSVAMLFKGNESNALIVEVLEKIAKAKNVKEVIDVSELYGVVKARYMEVSMHGQVLADEIEEVVLTSVTKQRVQETIAYLTKLYGKDGKIDFAIAKEKLAKLRAVYKNKPYSAAVQMAEFYETIISALEKGIKITGA